MRRPSMSSLHCLSTESRQHTLKEYKTMSEQTLEGFRLSPQQQHLWELRSPHLPPALGCTLRLRGALDSRRLSDSLRRCLLRHEILRTRFVSPEGVGVVLQAVSEVPACAFEEHDLSALAEPERAEALARLTEAETWRVFDVGGGEAVRAALVRLSVREWVLVLRVAVVCADLRSVRNLVEELLAVATKFGAYRTSVTPSSSESRYFLENRISTSDPSASILMTWA